MIEQHRRRRTPEEEAAAGVHGPGTPGTMRPGKRASVMIVAQSAGPDDGIDEALQAAEQAILLVDPGNPLQVGGGAVRRLACRDVHQPWLSRVRRSRIAALAREM